VAHSLGGLVCAKVSSSVVRSYNVNLDADDHRLSFWHKLDLLASNKSLPALEILHS